MKRALLVLTSIWAIACGTGTLPSDGGGALDSGVQDSGTTVADAGRDGGSSDSGASDSGFDAGPPLCPNGCNVTVRYRYATQNVCEWTASDCEASQTMDEVTFRKFLSPDPNSTLPYYEEVCVKQSSITSGWYGTLQPMGDGGYLVDCMGTDAGDNCSADVPFGEMCSGQDPGSSYFNPGPPFTDGGPPRAAGWYANWISCQDQSWAKAGGCGFCFPGGCP